ncbi:polysaccharide deacetylase family protein [Acrocarpospora catenulata]|uniref:polysaccharide deacetylase family protein n=1 Tax=Acrocarpospora catenulata TaxID=2836182 RepID=UPI001BDAA3F0|nr:polysaccharide deacetylase family protein [Acrocarpospora catenulata]
MRLIVRMLLAVVCTTGLLASSATTAQAVKPKPYCVKYKCIALTFDDGPWPYTPELLDTLKKYKAKATFFVLGRKVANRPEMMQRMVKEGHEVGNHTWDHPSLTELSDEDIVAEITSTQEVIYETIGRYPTMMRPPNGATNERVGERMAELGLPQILWTGSTLDWQARNQKIIKQRTLKLAKRNGVILLHDIVPETVKAMPAVLKTLKAKGYKFVTVSTLLGDRKLAAGEIWPPRPKKK